MTASLRVALVLAVSLAAAPARAQDEVDPARAAFVEGARAAGEHRVADALAAFERAYALSNNPAALFNVVQTLWGVGRYLDAVAAADRMLDAHPDLAADLRARVQDLRAQARARLAQLVLLGLAPDDVTRLDGRAVSPEGSPPILRTDPGPHDLMAERAGRAPFLVRVELGEGEVRPIELRFDPPDDGAGEVLGWTLGVGGAALAIAAAIAIGVFAQDAAQLDPVHDRVLRP